MWLILEISVRLKGGLELPATLCVSPGGCLGLISAIAPAVGAMEEEDQEDASYRYSPYCHASVFLSLPHTASLCLLAPSHFASLMSVTAMKLISDSPGHSPGKLVLHPVLSVTLRGWSSYFSSSTRCFRDG
ncbi:hypothetical protein KIL84_003518 [Mauremys mutica]|uniref:Uncharacterized protein n=1 Tax=Mauremys mutica TaxID=74926 RepID=A0A9D3WW13_9SAUR|nr:hypothetical protein KIL84_003518 [Mauremys mutica]